MNVGNGLYNILQIISISINNMKICEPLPIH